MAWRRLGGFLMMALLCAVASLPAAAANKDVIVRLGDSGRTTYQGANGDTVLEGGVKIEYGDTVITAQRAVVNMGAGKAHLTGGVTLVQGDVTLGSDAMDADLKKETAVLTGNVKLQKKEQQAEKDSSGKAKVSTIVMTCAYLDISTITQDFTATGPVSITVDKQKAQSAKATYSNAQKVLVLTGSVFIQGGDGETIKCDKASLHTDKEAIEAEGKGMEITFVIKD